MLGKYSSGGTIENAAMILSNANASRAITNQRKTDERPHVWCDYCNKPRHTQDTLLEDSWKTGKLKKQPNLDITIEKNIVNLYIYMYNIYTLKKN